MPYPVLDAIERWAIRDKYSPLQIRDLLVADYPDTSLDAIVGWVQRFFTLWSRNQWKRERYAPSFHLDDENLDPKNLVSIPNFIGGFRDELTQLGGV